MPRSWDECRGSCEAIVNHPRWATVPGSPPETIAGPAQVFPVSVSCIGANWHTYCYNAHSSSRGFLERGFLDGMVPWCHQLLVRTPGQLMLPVCTFGQLMLPIPCCGAFKKAVSGQLMV